MIPLFFRKKRNLPTTYSRGFTTTKTYTQDIESSYSWKQAGHSKYTITTITETIDIIAWWGLAVLQSKRRDQHQKATLSWDKRTKFISYLAPTITTYFITYNYYVTPERDRLNWKYSIKFCTAAQLSVQEYFSSYNNWVTVGSSKQLHLTFEWKKSCSLIFSSFVITSSPLQASS